HVGHLAARVDAGIGAAGDGDANGLVLAHDARQARLHHALDSAQPGLGGPSREVRAVIRKDEAGPHHLSGHGARLVFSVSYLASSSDSPASASAASSAASIASSTTASSPSAASSAASACLASGSSPATGPSAGASA